MPTINGPALEAIRTYAGLSQAALARRTEEHGEKVSQGRISELESDTAKSQDKKTVRPATAKALADALGVPVLAIILAPSEVAS